MIKELTFKINKKNILNSNSLPSHFIVKGKIASYLHELGYETGLVEHNDKTKDIIIHRKTLLDSEKNNKTIKSRITKKIKKDNPDLTKKELDKLVNEEFDKGNFALEEKSLDVDFTPLFNHFKITAIVSPPTARRLDPPNLAPTTKYLIDGLTSAGFWIDDDWEHLHEMSFKYGEISGEKDTFIITMIIEEL